MVDIDSTIPNLALMKLSAWYKQNGHTTKLILHPVIPTVDVLFDYDKITASVVFEKNVSKAKQLKSYFSDVDVDVGGYFYDKHKVLPDEIEHIMPDYSLYKGKVCQKCGHNIKSCVCRHKPIKGDMWYSTGFTTRGCIRKCKWCIVPEKEGMIYPNADIYEFWNREHTHIDLLDNNPMALPSQFKKIAKQLIKEDLTVSFHGLDARLLNDENTELLSQLRIKPEPRFAFDTPGAEKGVLRAIGLMNKHGIKRALWYVLVGFNTTWEEDMHRVLLLKKHNQRPYVMRYKTVKDPNHPDYTKYNLFASWVNQYKFFHIMDFDKFIELTDDRSKIHYRKQKITLENWE